MPKPDNQKTPAAAPAAAPGALQAVQAAMDEYARLDGLRTSLPASLAAAERYRDDCADAVKAAEADAILSGGMANRSGAAEARGKLAEAEGSVTALRHAIEGVGPKLAAADLVLAEAIKAADGAIMDQRRAAVAVYSGRLAEAVAGLKDVLHHGHALAAAGVFSRERHLGAMLIPHPYHGGEPLLAGSTLAPNTPAAENLAVTWPDSPEAAAIHAELRPLLQLQGTMSLHTDRLRRQEEDAWMERNRRARENPSYAPARGFTPRAPEPEYVPPKGTFVANSWILPIPAPPPVPGANGPGVPDFGPGSAGIRLQPPAPGVQPHELAPVSAPHPHDNVGANEL